MKPEIQEWKGWVNGTCSKPVGVSVEAVRPGSAMKGGGRGGACNGGRLWVANTQYSNADSVLWNCAPETYVILLTKVTPITSILKV